MKQKAEIFYGIKNKEETDRKYLVGCVYTVSLVCGEKTQTWFSVWGLSGHMVLTAFLVQQNIYRNTKVMSSILLIWHWAGATPS